MLNVAVC